MTHSMASKYHLKHGPSSTFLDRNRDLIYEHIGMIELVKALLVTLDLGFALVQCDVRMN